MMTPDAAMLIFVGLFLGVLFVLGMAATVFACPIEEYKEDPTEKTIYLDLEEFKTYYYLSPGMYILTEDRAYAYPGNITNPNITAIGWVVRKEEMTEIRFYKKDFRKYCKFRQEIRDNAREMTMNKAYSKFLVDRVQRDINIRRDQANKEIHESTQAMKDIAVRVIDERIQEIKKESVI